MGVDHAVSIAIEGIAPCANCPMRGDTIGSVDLYIRVLQRRKDPQQTAFCFAMEDGDGSRSSESMSPDDRYGHTTVSTPRSLVRGVEQNAAHIASTFEQRVAACGGPNAGSCPALSRSLLRRLIEQT